jgi:outer membrane immunogenic protein
LTTTSTITVSRLELGVNYKFNSGPTQPAGNAASPYPAGRIGEPALVYKSLSHGPYNWSGVYFGGDGGFGWVTAKGTLTDAASNPLTAYDYQVNGPVAGLFAGGNYQFNKIVLGLEGDWQWSNLMGNSQTLAPLGAAGTFPSGPFMISNTVADYASVRGRLGFAFDRFLAFGTVGWAWGNPLNSYALVGSAPFVNRSGSATGWTAGVGLDYGITESVFARVEYRYTNLATAGFVSADTNSAETADRVPINDLRAGIAYKI